MTAEELRLLIHATLEWVENHSIYTPDPGGALSIIVGLKKLRIDISGRHDKEVIL